ncbi:response regulator transcription factor [Spirochaeta isovalerica]|uniref:Phosphate regulon transcriptional regulatory protein PhoB n=1 Tax=Spirochaeta isovalerica TaxID=150 RepID=A0A841RC12_9SPIO|nr:response regulator transcription factor [Spirochaeta isovalerica]MBB6480429.1 DNA-binding response OmpR family regulator [Spirochaeta isovalerica]
MEQDFVLIVEDDSEISKILSVNIEDLGLKTRICDNGQDGLELARSGKFSLIILDIMLPRLDGVSLLRELRKSDARTPVLMVTARDSELDRVLGLELGADDYMSKPFSVREMTARVKALLRRSQLADDANGYRDKPVSIGKLTLDPLKRKALLGKKEVDLTVKEFDLLSLFMKNPGRAYSRSDLLNLIWGYQFEGYEHTVNTHINRLRAKIEIDPGKPEYLKTVWGVGYRFAEENELSHD